jgi:hypothetical protein
MNGKIYTTNKKLKNITLQTKSMSPNKFVPMLKMVMNNFGKGSSMQPMGRLNMHS